MKILKKINFIFLIIIILSNLFFIVRNFYHENFSHLFSNLFLFLCLLFPYFFKSMFKLHFSELFKFVYYIYIVLTILLGIEFGLIKNTLWFDKIVHFCFGFLLAISAVLILKYNCKDIQKPSIFKIIFIIGFTLLIADCWEFGEYTLDVLFHTNHQRWIQTCVNDTMLDLLVAFFGSLLVSTSYFIEAKFQKNGFIFHAIEYDSSKRQSIEF